MSTSLAIVGCSSRKRQTSRTLPALERYDGPIFRVLRKHRRETSQHPLHVRILSARFGLIPDSHLTPRYDRQLRDPDAHRLRKGIGSQVSRTFEDLQPERVFVSLGPAYWQILEKDLVASIGSAQLVVAKGGIGGRASQLVHWLNPAGAHPIAPPEKRGRGKATLLGTTVQWTSAEVVEMASAALRSHP